ncbi:MAG TPA: N-acetylmuramoyl-L-alanine amidase [Longimicrobium sp.]|nr:N-acetylmuramoyl-L-alanine amidase [Longimicrobium sp.]
MLVIRSFRGPVAASLALALGAGACRPAPPAGPSPSGPPAPVAYVPLTAGLPPIPTVDAPLAIRIVAPEAGQTRPRRDSTFIYGTVGTGGAALLVNGAQVPVAPNGAFIGYLPVPADGVWRLQAFKNGETAEASYTYRTPTPNAPRPQAGTATEESATPSATPAPAASPVTGVFPAPLDGTVRRGGDTLATGSDAVYARPTPSGVYRWFFPRGTRLRVVERRGGQFRVQLGAGTTAWIDTVNVALATGGPATPASASAREATFRGGASPELRIPAGFAPFLVEADSAGVHVTVYGSGGAMVNVAGLDDFATGAGREQVADATRYNVQLSRWVWGYKAFYEADGTLVVRLRRPPRIDAANPLRGIRIVVDPGHPPAGAIGPTGYHEKDANLGIGLRLAERLRAAGADVRLTRTADVVVDLAARPAMAVAQDADLLISVHNNAFGEEANPFRDHGTSTYWFQPMSRDLCRTLDREIAGVTQIPDLGAKFGNLALVRPTWMPSCLTESLFMPIPEQEAALQDTAFLDRLAEAHVAGIAAFLRMRAAP